MERIENLQCIPESMQTMRRNLEMDANTRVNPSGIVKEGRDNDVFMKKNLFHAACESQTLREKRAGTETRRIGFGAKTCNSKRVIVVRHFAAMSHATVGNGESALFGNRAFDSDEMTRLRATLNLTMPALETRTPKSNECATA